MATTVHEARDLWESKLTPGVEPDEIDWWEVFEAGWKAGVSAVAETILEEFAPEALRDEYDNRESAEPSDDFPLYLEYPQEDDSMYLNERLYGEE